MPIDDKDLAALLPELDPAADGQLDGAGTYDGLRFESLDLAGDATEARFLECELRDCVLDGVVFDRSRMASCRVAGARAADVSVVDSTWLDVVVTGGRFGALTMHGAQLTRVLFSEVTIDFLNLRGAPLADVGFTGCRIGELHLGGAELRDVRFADCTVGSLVLTGARNRGVDLRGAAIERLETVADLPGCTISSAQLAGWADALAAHLGIRVA